MVVSSLAVERYAAAVRLVRRRSSAAPRRAISAGSTARTPGSPRGARSAVVRRDGHPGVPSRNSPSVRINASAFDVCTTPGRMR